MTQNILKEYIGANGRTRAKFIKDLMEKHKISEPSASQIVQALKSIKLMSYDNDKGLYFWNDTDDNKLKDHLKESPKTRRQIILFLMEEYGSAKSSAAQIVQALRVAEVTRCEDGVYFWNGE